MWASISLLIFAFLVCLASPALGDENAKDQEEVEVDETKVSYARGSVCGYCEYCKVCATQTVTMLSLTWLDAYRLQTRQYTFGI